jgi:hypothetical protein
MSKMVDWCWLKLLRYICICGVSCFSDDDFMLFVVVTAGGIVVFCSAGTVLLLYIP